MTLKLLTLNIWNRDGPWKQRAQLIRRWVERLAPDLVALQEVLRGPGIDQLDDLFGGTPYDVAYARSRDFWEDEALDFGNAVASRWPILERDELELPRGDRGDRRIALGVDVEAPVGRVSFTSTHLMYAPHLGRIRELQAVAVGTRVIERRPRDGLPPILCGDLNARPEAAEIRFLAGLQSLEGRSVFLLDAWEQAGSGPGHTMSRRNPYATDAPFDARIDYVFVGPPAPGGPGRIRTCRVVCDEAEGGVWPSDHFGVYAELET